MPSLLKLYCPFIQMMASNTSASSKAKISAGKIAFERPVEITNLISVLASCSRVALLCSAIIPLRLKVSSISKNMIFGVGVLLFIMALAFLSIVNIMVLLFI